MSLCLGLFLNIYPSFLIAPSYILINGILRRVTIFIYILTFFHLLHFIMNLNLLSIVSIVFFDGQILLEIVDLIAFLFLYLLIFFLLIFDTDSLKSTNINKVVPETFFIQFTCIIGFIYLISATDWTMTLISWELFNLSLYLLVTLYSTSHSLPASLKYFLLSALSTSFFFLAIVFIYFSTGATSYHSLHILSSYFDLDLFLSPYFFILLTLLFKLGAAPLHNWAPDLYDSLTLNSVLWMITIPKFLVLLFLFHIQLKMPSFSYHYLLYLFASCSAIFGCLGLITQFRIKRFFAYSSITNLGFILFLNPSSIIFLLYTFLYLFTTLFIFAIISIWQLSLGYSILSLHQLKGLFYLNPPLAFAFSFSIFSLAGFPPLAGFYSKFIALFHLISSRLIFIPLLLISSSVIGATNYLNLIKTTLLPHQPIHSHTSFQFTHLKTLSTNSVSSIKAFFITLFIGFILISLFNVTNLMDFVLWSF